MNVSTNDGIDDLDFSAPALDAQPRIVRTDAADHIQQQDPGDASGEAIPVPIPNTEVKLSSAEDTERAAFRENRSSPGFCAFQGVFGSLQLREDRPERPGAAILAPR